MKRRPMTTDELFNRIVMILKEKNRLPDILDYGLATGNARSEERRVGKECRY